MSAENENLPPRVIKEIAKELKSLDESPPGGIKVVVNDDNFSTIFADIEGPVGTPYECGIFQMKLVLTPDFPNSPPKGYFVIKIFHPNVANNGEICVNTLKKDWNPTLGLRHVILVIRCLLVEPFPESALNEQAGKMFMEDYEAYAKHASLSEWKSRMLSSLYSGSVCIWNYQTQISGAKVKLHDSQSGGSNRVIEISGTPEQTHAAKSLLQAFIATGGQSQPTRGAAWGY